MILNGRALAKEVLARAAERASRLPQPPKVVVIVANETPATKSYLAIKSARAADAGCVLVTMHFSEHEDTATLRAAVSRADADALVVQLPLPPGVDLHAVCNAIPLEKDADVLSLAARGKAARGVPESLLPPVVAAVKEILTHGNVVTAGKRAVVIGSGFLVGEPVAAWLVREGAEVTVVDRGDDLSGALLHADLIISGAGSPHLIKPEMLKEGVVLIDAGTSEASGKIVGDADLACAPVCSLFTPVPGGIGPIAVAKLFENAVLLAERKVSF